KTLKGLTPFEYICKIWTKEPERFRLDPTHQTLGLNIINWIRQVAGGDRIAPRHNGQLLGHPPVQKLKAANAHSVKPASKWTPASTSVRYMPSTSSSISSRLIPKALASAYNLCVYSLIETASTLAVSGRLLPIQRSRKLTPRVLMNA
ncbi:hypothetical protein NKJ79_13705, partial [Mesorhizobium sp. M0041]